MLDQAAVEVQANGHALRLDQNSRPNSRPGSETLRWDTPNSFQIANSHGQVSTRSSLRWVASPHLYLLPTSSNAAVPIRSLSCSKSSICSRMAAVVRWVCRLA